MIHIDKEGDGRRLLMDGKAITLLHDAITIVDSITSVVFRGEDGEKLLDEFPALVRDFRASKEKIDVSMIKDILGGSSNDNQV